MLRYSPKLIELGDRLNEWHDILVIVDIDGDGLVEVHVSNADLELYKFVRNQDADGKRSISLTPLLLLQQMTVCWHAVVFWQT